MKKNIHPDYHPITIVMTDGTELPSKSTWGKAGDRLILDIDPKCHMAWTKQQHFTEKGQLARFNQRFQALNKVSAKPSVAEESTPEGSASTPAA